MDFNFKVRFENGKCFVNDREYKINSDKPHIAFSILMHHAAHDLSFWKTNGLYNRAVYWTDYVEFSVQYLLSKKYEIRPTKHMKDKIEKLKLPATCYKAMLYGEVVEAEMDHGEVKKIITRLQSKHYPTEDMCAAIVFENDEYGTNIAKVKTIWLNAHNDNHKTIDTNAYMTKEKEDSVEWF